jgi:hypothetical protein
VANVVEERQKGASRNQEGQILIFLAASQGSPGTDYGERDFSANPLRIRIGEG